MKAISISPEYALDILAGNKKVEFRSWQTNHRGDLLICSTAKKIKGTIPGHALIVCRLDNIKKISEKKYGWKLTDFRIIKPFPVKGQQRLYDVPDEKIIFVPEIDNGTEEDALEFVEKYFDPLFI
ncbi:MAG: ASCH domain-containing protein [Eubacterium sp.]